MTDHHPFTPEQDAELVRALARARLESRQSPESLELTRRNWRRFVTEHPEAEILVLDPQPLATPAQRARALALARRALEPKPSRLFVAGASLLVLVAFGVGLGILFAAGRVVYCALVGCG